MYQNHLGTFFRMLICRIPSWGSRQAVSLGQGLSSTLVSPLLRATEM